MGWNIAWAIRAFLASEIMFLAITQLFTLGSQWLILFSSTNFKVIKKQNFWSPILNLSEDFISIQKNNVLRNKVFWFGQNQKVLPCLCWQSLKTIWSIFRLNKAVQNLSVCYSSFVTKKMLRRKLSCSNSRMTFG